MVPDRRSCCSAELKGLFPMLDIRLEDPAVAGQTLQQQLHQGLVDAILEGRLPSHEPLPSTRDLASALKVSRNTVVLVYQRLLDDGYLTAVWRRGHFVNEQYIRQQSHVEANTIIARITQHTVIFDEPGLNPAPSKLLRMSFIKKLAT